MNDHRKRIFVVKQGGIGDVILATPVLAELKRCLPDSSITLMIFSNARDLVDGLSFIDEVFCYDKKKDGFWKLWRRMRGHDVAIFLDLTYRPALTAALSGIPIRVGIEHKRGAWLTKKIRWQESMDHTYEPYVLGDIVNAALDLRIPHERLDIPAIVPATSDDRDALREWLKEAGLPGGNSGKPYIVSSPITAFHLKNWPLERWNALYRQLFEAYGMRTVLFGGGTLEYPWDREAVVDLWGKLNLRQVGELIRNAALLVNSCSMPIHIAAAVSTPSVVLYGYGDPKRWAPRRNCVTVVTDLPCSPCDGYHGSTCTDPQCMKRMSLEEVFAACRKQLGDCV